MNLNLTYEMTTNCNYNCEYCNARKTEKFSDKLLVDNVINFLAEANTDSAVTDIKLQIMGGESSIHPLFYYIFEKLNSNNKLKILLFTNLSASIETYDKICDLGKIYKISSSFHQNHCVLDEFKHKTLHLLHKFPNIIIHTNCMLENNRYSQKELIKIFSEFCVYQNYEISMFPILRHKGSFKSYNTAVDNNKQLEIFVDKNTKNKKNNTLTDCYVQNAFITSDGKLCRCFQKKNTINIDINDTKAYNKYKMIRTLKLNCDKDFCYFGTDWQQVK